MPESRWMRPAGGSGSPAASCPGLPPFSRRALQQAAPTETVTHRRGLLSPREVCAGFPPASRQSQGHESPCSCPHQVPKRKELLIKTYSRSRTTFSWCHPVPHGKQAPPTPTQCPIGSSPPNRCPTGSRPPPPQPGAPQGAGAGTNAGSAPCHASLE